MASQELFDDLSNSSRLVVDLEVVRQGVREVISQAFEKAFNPKLVAIEQAIESLRLSLNRYREGSPTLKKISQPHPLRKFEIPSFITSQQPKVKDVQMKEVYASPLVEDVPNVAISIIYYRFKILI